MLTSLAEQCQERPPGADAAEPLLIARQTSTVIALPTTMQNSPLFDAHPRSFAANRYVYPVLSRRAGGISIGVNLSLDQFCNFHCIYCQVDRSQPAEPEFVGLRRLAEELDERSSWSSRAASTRARNFAIPRRRSAA